MLVKGVVFFKNVHGRILYSYTIVLCKGVFNLQNSIPNPIYNPFSKHYYNPATYTGYVSNLLALTLTAYYHHLLLTTILPL